MVDERSIKQMNEEGEGEEIVKKLITLDGGQIHDECEGLLKEDLITIICECVDFIKPLEEEEE